MRYFTYGETPTRAETRAVVLAGDNRSAPGTRNYASSQPLQASETVASLSASEYNVQSTKDRQAADKMWGRPPAIIPSGPLMGSGPQRAPATGAKETREPPPEKYNQSRARMVAKFTAAGYNRFKGPTLKTIYAGLPARTIENRLAYAEGDGPPPASDKFEAAAARGEKLLRLAADAVARFGADYQPLLDEARDILNIAAEARLSGAEIPPSTVTRLDVLEKGITGQLGERVGLTRGVSPADLRAAATSPAELRTIATDTVNAAVGPLGPAIADLARIVGDLAASIPGGTTDLIAAATNTVAEAAAAGGVPAAVSAASGAITALTPASDHSAVNDALRKLRDVAEEEAKRVYDTEVAVIASRWDTRNATTSSRRKEIERIMIDAKIKGSKAVNDLTPASWVPVARLVNTNTSPNAKQSKTFVKELSAIITAEKPGQLDLAKKKYDATLADIANAVDVAR